MNTLWIQWLNETYLFVKRDGLSEVSEQIVGVTQVATGATLRRLVTQLDHQIQVLSDEERQQ